MNQAMTPAGEPLEIERKFLIRRPDRALLERHSTGCLVMEQIYLTRRQKGESRRIRQSTREGQTLYYYNEKVRLSSMKTATGPNLLTTKLRNTTTTSLSSLHRRLITHSSS